MDPTSLIITLRMDPGAAERFTRLRQAHFPAHRNWLAAHVTFFHALPLAALDDVLRDVADVAGRTDAFRMDVDRVLFLGQGVAYGITSARAKSLRGELAARWEALLGRQDRAWHGRLHVTVQNKVEPAVARELHARLQRELEMHDIGATGLQVWEYVGGPWRHVATFPFPDAAVDPRVGDA
ncbi:MAG: 2'-5' RNA ligase family protein [Variovorax sp.]|nr:MAG: 2'-5' RNA ligase family protein [Variovorax sp.]